MSHKAFQLLFQGYWWEQTLKDIPRRPGVFVVYEGKYNHATDDFILHKIVCIDEGENVHDRVLRHEKWKEWQTHCNSFSHLCFGFAPVDGSAEERRRVKAALIYRHKPPFACEHKDEFSFAETTVTCMGKIDHLEPAFTVLQTD